VWFVCVVCGSVFYFMVLVLFGRIGCVLGYVTFGWILCIGRVSF